MAVSEAILQEQVADYLRLQYPQVVFHSDTGSITRLTPRQGARRKRQNGGRRAWPDMFIAQASENVDSKDWNNKVREWGFYFGLFLELKKDGTRLKKRNGEWASEHIAEQAEVMQKLREEGYKAVFAVGFEAAKKEIDDYLGGEK